LETFPNYDMSSPSPGVRHRDRTVVGFCLSLVYILSSHALPTFYGPESIGVLDPRGGAHEGNDRPLIGILSQSLGPHNSSSYIAASYVKFVEAAGARAVPILQDMPRGEMKRRFNAVNGILIPGGSQNLSPGHPYYEATKFLLNLTVQDNDHGVYFPLHATCLGFEALAVAVSGNTSVIRDYDATDYPQPLIPTHKADSSRFFSSLPKHIVEALYSKVCRPSLSCALDGMMMSLFLHPSSELTHLCHFLQEYAMENHVHGVHMDGFAENPSLLSFFDILSLSLDRQGEMYVSTIEAKDYPISATQWHPEKNAFEWGAFNIPHDAIAVLVTQSVANAFINLARRNSHAPSSREEEDSLLIYNWSKNIEFTGRASGSEEGSSSFDQVYVFPPYSPSVKQHKSMTTPSRHDSLNHHQVI
jgi:gamma-glutamyl hydrolase